MAGTGQQLVAILFTDIVGYTSLMGRDAEEGMKLLRRNRDIHKSTIDKHNGEYLKEIGDGTLAKFNSAIDSVLCALEIQQKASDQLEAQLRIGINLGDITVENNDVFGDGVNIASRIQSIADPGGIYISESIYQAIRARKDVDSDLIGDVQLKNVDHPVKVYFLKEKHLPLPSSEKIKKLTHLQRKRGINQLWLIVITGMILASFLAYKFWLQDSTTPGIRSLVVLPVENISAVDDEEWLSAGIHYGLIDELMKVQSLRVVSRTSAMKYESTNKSVPEIASELDVDGIVEVSYMKNEDDLNIQVRLIRAKPQEQQVWSSDFNRDIQDILTTYSDVARSVAEEINITLSSREKNRLASNRRVDPDAYEAYLKGLMHWSKLGETDLDVAMEYFRKARDIDPEFPLAYAGIARVWGGRMIGGYISYNEAAPELEKAMEKALMLDSTLVQIHYLKAVFHTWYFWNWEIAKREYLKTLDLNPNHADANAYYAHYQAIRGRPGKGLPYSEKALEIERFNTRLKALYGMALRHAYKPEKAIDVLEKAYIESPNEIIILSTLRSAYHDVRMYRKAIDAGKKYYAIKGDSTNVKVLGRAFNEKGYKYALRRNAETMVSRRDTAYVTPWQIATLYTRAGMKKEALTWLEKAYEDHDANMPYISADPIFDFLEDEPRFQDILQKMELD